MKIIIKCWKIFILYNKYIVFAVVFALEAFFDNSFNSFWGTSQMFFYKNDNLIKIEHMHKVYLKNKYKYNNIEE